MLNRAATSSRPLDMDEISGSFSPEAQSHISRIFQESLTNIGKYAQAIRVSLAIKRQVNPLVAGIILLMIGLILVLYITLAESGEKGLLFPGKILI